MKKMPYGILNYKELILENYRYIDKTMYLEKLENAGITLIYLRPRIFGKSLFTSMMYYYYDLNSKDLFDKLFKDTYVYNNPTKGKNSYYVLRFDFSGITSADKNKKELEEQFKSKLISGIKNFANDYKFNIETKGKTANQVIVNFLDDFKSLALENKIYILIDEYDNFTNAILEGSAERFKNIVGNAGFIKTFYESLKKYTDLGVVGRIFVTGMCPITLDIIPTKINIATDISNDIEFNSMIGFTHKEVDSLLNGVVEEKNKREEIKNIMIKNYGGYLFNKNATEKVFNATLVMYLLRFYESYKKIPEELFIITMGINSKKIENLIELKNNNFYKDLLNEIMENEPVKGFLKIKFDLLEDFNRDDIISLLYYYGYLTIEPDKNGGYYFKIPNAVIKVLYGNYFTRKLHECGIEYDNKTIIETVKELITGSIDKLSNYVSEVLKKLDNRDFIKLNEKGIKIIYFTMLLNNQYYNVYSEYQSNNGYIDIYLNKKKPILRNVIIKLKYIKKKDYNENLLQEKIKEGTSQLENYSKDKRLDNPVRYLVVFVGNELKSAINVNLKDI